MKFLLSVIALCLVMITAKLYIPEAQAEIGGMDAYELRYDDDFVEAVTRTVKVNCYVNATFFVNCDKLEKYGKKSD
ncbi:hypothetical protein OAC45_04035 [Gammaproteobacteria bacterium]|nr:hypothetical protein [Gammaproteobacteria bacterium]